jgi:hypothetical protein
VFSCLVTSARRLIPGGLISLSDTCRIAPRRVFFVLLRPGRAAMYAPASGSRVIPSTAICFLKRKLRISMRGAGNLSWKGRVIYQCEFCVLWAGAAK